MCFVSQASCRHHRGPHGRCPRCYQRITAVAKYDVWRKNRHKIPPGKFPDTPHATTRLGCTAHTAPPPPLPSSRRHPSSAQFPVSARGQSCLRIATRTGAALDRRSVLRVDGVRWFRAEPPSTSAWYSAQQQSRGGGHTRRCMQHAVSKLIFDVAKT